MSAMKLKQTLRWEIQSMGKAIAVFYMIMLALYILMAVVVSVFASRVDLTYLTVGGGGTSSIMLAVLGIVMAWQTVRVGLTHGVSRKTLFTSIIIMSLLCVISMTLIDLALDALFSFITGIKLDSAFKEATLSMIVYPLATNLLSVAAGYFIGAAYYRMNKAMKIFVSIFVPTLVIIVIPIVFSYSTVIFPASVVAAIADLMGWIGASINNQSLIMGIGAVLSMFFVWLLIRRAPAKPEQG